MLDYKTRSDLRPKQFSVLYASACAVLVSVIALLYRGGFGTHRASFHLTAVALYAAYFILTGRKSRNESLRRLLSFPSDPRWFYRALALGVLSGLLRLGTYYFTGLGGVGFYRDAFVPQLRADQPVELIGRWCLFAVLLYAATLLPGLLFCGVIQESFNRTGLLWLGVIVQALSFGTVHSSMSGVIDPFYGVEAGVGAVIYGLVYHSSQSLHPSALFMGSNIIVCVSAVWLLSS